MKQITSCNPSQNVPLELHTILANHQFSPVHNYFAEQFPISHIIVSHSPIMMRKCNSIPSELLIEYSLKKKRQHMTLRNAGLE